MQYSSRFNSLMIDIFKREGGYSNHSADKGKVTNKGITQLVYDSFRQRNNLSEQSVRYITINEALEIYYREYYSPLSADAIKDESSADILFDLAINSGVNRAKLFENQYGYDPIILLNRRKNLYTNICERSPSQRIFLRGWLARLDKIASKYNLKWSSE